MTNRIIDDYKPLVEKALAKYLSFEPSLYDTVVEAMNYSVAGSGKRIRPCLLLEFSRLCGGNRDAALQMAAALEMIHTYSLIHDDLPAMDNDDMRRGKPSCHIKFGEDIAILAGDALLTHAFYTAASCSAAPADAVQKSIKIMAEYAGATGMVGGQVIDLQSENKTINLEILTTLCELKTSRLIETACVVGCLIAGADEAHQKSAFRYGHNLGLAFQIVDDILDATATAETLGKPVGSDKENHKNTFLTLLGLEGAKKAAHDYTNEAISALEVFREDTTDLKELTRALCSRRF